MAPQLSFEKVEPMTSLEIAAERDYYYREGMNLRPAPRRDAPSWSALRRFLFEQWMQVPPRWEHTEQTLLLDDHMWEGDELMDAVVRMFVRLGPTEGRELFEAALRDGVDALDDPPSELVELFEHVARRPDWYDPEAAERGRLRLCLASDAAKAAAGGFGVFATAMEEDVSAAVGSTGRIVRRPVQRSVETYKFFEEVTYRGAFTPGSEILKTVLRVRLMHSLVRRGLRKSWGDDNFAEHGMPISNTNMAAGSAWFGSMSVLIDHRMGRPLELRELDDISMHWGYILYLFGVAERIIPKSGRESIHLANHVFASAGEPSVWRRELVEALLQPVAAAGDEAVRDFLGGAALVMGTAEVERLLEGTRHAGFDVEHHRRRVELAARSDAALTLARDADPVRRREVEMAARDGDPWWMMRGEAVRGRMADDQEFGTPFRHHDGSAGGADFTPASHAAQVDGSQA